MDSLDVRAVFPLMFRLKARLAPQAVNDSNHPTCTVAMKVDDVDTFGRIVLAMDADDQPTANLTRPCSIKSSPEPLEHLDRIDQGQAIAIYLSPFRNKRECCSGPTVRVMLKPNMPA